MRNVKWFDYIEVYKCKFQKYRLLFAFPYCVGVLISLFAPLDVLDYEFPNLIVRYATEIFPMVRQMKGEYEIGQVSKLYFSVMWFFSPVIVWYFCLNLQANAGVMVPKFRKRKLFSLISFVLITPFVFFGAVFVNMEFNNPDSWRDYLSFRSRVGLNIYGVTIPVGACGMFALTYFYIKNIRVIFKSSY